MKSLATMLTLLTAFGVAASAFAADEPTTTTVLDNLNNPTAVAIQPETGHVFVSDSGNGKIIRVVDGKAEDVIVDFPKDVYGKGPMYDIGPLGLHFLNKTTLVVGGGGLPDGEEMLRVYTVPDAGKDAIKADAMKASFTLAADGDIKGEGNFYGLAATADAVFVTCNGDDTKGWVSKAKIEGDTITGFERSIATKEKTEVDAPVAATISPAGDLVIGQMGEISVPGDGLLTFYNPNDGEMLLNLETGLSDITALAYAPMPKPKKRQLYALDYSWSAPEEGGLFQLLKRVKDDKQSVEARKIASLDKPTGMIFAEDGTLYITVIGTAEEGAETKPGKLLKLEGKF
ncbi:hypothetical protein Pla8534_48610 [Lignipirellula cremea]|uniref:NHL repeat protein n=2 Tax=Lignipirellula cremea TaxID=2528010 RepID=A0A518DYW8_9BACT|nr:hypothetical protein Pla8534_48610 [Lignipirellula cremea]